MKSFLNPFDDAQEITASSSKWVQVSVIPYHRQSLSTKRGADLPSPALQRACVTRNYCLALRPIAKPQIHPHRLRVRRRARSLRSAMRTCRRPTIPMLPLHRRWMRVAVLHATRLENVVNATS